MCRLKFKIIGRDPRLFLEMFSVKTSRHDCPRTTQSVIEVDPIIKNKAAKSAPIDDPKDTPLIKSSSLTGDMDPHLVVGD